MTAGMEIVAVGAAVAAALGAMARISTHRSIHVLGIPFLLAGWLGLLVTVAPQRVLDKWIVLAAAGVVLLVGGWWLAGRLRGREHWLLAAGALVLTVRLPVPTGDGEAAMLLGPLYAVIALGALVLLRSELAQLVAGATRIEDRGSSTRLLDIGVAAFPILAAFSLQWSGDRAAGALMLGCFLVPFLLLYALVRAWLADGVALRPAAIALVASAVVAALVGIVQAAIGEVWWNPKVIDANRFRADFRTNSFFWDPNIYGRALVVAALALVALLLVTRLRARAMTGVSALLALLTVALWLTYSQSSWVALACALVLLAVLTLPPRSRRAVTVLLVAGAFIATPIAADRLAGDDASGRAHVVRTGLALTAERPVLGAGIGSFEQAARARARRQGSRSPGLVASHTTPVTVIAELGVLGAVSYLMLLTSALLAVLARWRRSATADSAIVPGWPQPALAWASAAFIAILAHSFLYAGFFEDPALWVALAILASLPVISPRPSRP